MHDVAPSAVSIADAIDAISCTMNFTVSFFVIVGNFKWLVLACHLEPSLPLSSRPTILSFCHFDRPSSHFVISTERSEWRNLMNAPKGASGKPQRCLDYARHDKGGEGALARHDRVGRERRSDGATAPTFNLPHLGCHGQNRRHCLAARSLDPRCHRYRCW